MCIYIYIYIYVTHLHIYIYKQRISAFDVFRCIQHSFDAFDFGSNRILFDVVNIGKPATTCLTAAALMQG